MDLLLLLYIHIFVGTNSTGKGVDIGHSDDTGGEDDSFEPKDGSLGVVNRVGNAVGRHSGVFRGVSQNQDPSRSSSLVSEASSQPDMHPFYKVCCQMSNEYQKLS